MYGCDGLSFSSTCPAALTCTRLKAAARQHHGHAGRAFLLRLTRDTETDFSAALEAIKSLPEFTPTGDDGQVKRAAARFALQALAGELATAYGVTPWPTGEAVRAAAFALRHVLRRVWFFSDFRANWKNSFRNGRGLCVLPSAEDKRQPKPKLAGAFRLGSAWSVNFIRN